jgi:hypothetical protein
MRPGEADLRLTDWTRARIRDHAIARVRGGCMHRIAFAKTA